MLISPSKSRHCTQPTTPRLVETWNCTLLEQLQSLWITSPWPAWLSAPAQRPAVFDPVGPAKPDRTKARQHKQDQTKKAQPTQRVGGGGEDEAASPGFQSAVAFVARDQDFYNKVLPSSTQPIGDSYRQPLGMHTR
ncbi:unnamed protein product [Polarella glacialis]|uniref:Uncharacterized protein n=1 Tax=Polarella glacialis TaxID=89957 RepID=A0A813GB11_POLGL|nr:unnamed protein product [Polarella glacialis]